MGEKAGSEFCEIVKFPATKEQKIPMTFYFKSKKEDVERVMLEHHAEWIVKALKEYPLPQRKAIYEKMMEKLESS